MSFGKRIKMLILTCLVFSLILSLSIFSLAQDISWPKRAIEIYSPGGPGGDTDYYARVFAKYAEKELGVNVVVINPGAGGSALGTRVAIRNANPDGYSAIFTHYGLLTEKLVGLVDWGVEEYALVDTVLANKGNGFFAKTGSGIETLKDLIDKAKENPGKINFATNIGKPTHLQALMFQDLTGIEMNLVDVGNEAEKVKALLGGDVDVAASTYGTCEQYIKNDDFVCLGYASDEKIKEYQGETFIEQGVDLVTTKWFFLAFPKGTDEKIVEKMQKVVENVTKNPDFQKEINEFYKGTVPMSLGTAAAWDFVKKEEEELFKYKYLFE